MILWLLVFMIFLQKQCTTVRFYQEHRICTFIQILPNNGFYIVTFDAIPDVDTAERFRNQSVFIDREQYNDYKDKLYMSDLINKPVFDENGEKLGDMVDYDDYGATIILTIKIGAVSYQIPYVADIIVFDRDKNAFVIEKQKFEDLKI